MKTTLFNWYAKNYPSDDLGQEITPDTTFADLETALNNNWDVYVTIGVADSLVRERLFEKLAELKQVDYSEIYNKWLSI
jgi:hypothetical protein